MHIFYDNKLKKTWIDPYENDGFHSPTDGYGSVFVSGADIDATDIVLNTFRTYPTRLRGMRVITKRINWERVYLLPGIWCLVYDTILPHQTYTMLTFWIHACGIRMFAKFFWHDIASFRQPITVCFE